MLTHTPLRQPRLTLISGKSTVKVHHCPLGAFCVPPTASPLFRHVCSGGPTLVELHRWRYVCCLLGLYTPFLYIEICHKYIMIWQMQDCSNKFKGSRTRHKRDGGTVLHLLRYCVSNSWWCCCVVSLSKPLSLSQCYNNWVVWSCRPRVSSASF